ncbi:hypothetical protein G3480_24310 [Thiorhodococcus mannitoliphagus]|uniref:Uncharacterized protein n=1 Tax=Thiorhodococcus mannitoliphagus TaxID=329406 RepID=A0A6P1DYS8_9GAMM|nr:hypothetical protein [Thiorhodococcus mannitoliphagus]NEX23378.1 hypothetical protein [Thiorhodococcus mannitoliphagus]
MQIRDLKKQLLRPAILVLCIGAACSAHALSLVVDGGEIAGVLAVEIQGQSYDVTFTDGSFNDAYPAGLNGYGPLARDVAAALLAASEDGAISADPKWQPGLQLRGCEGDGSCTILIPDHSGGEAPVAQITFAVEVIYSMGQFRSVTPKLWPFDASTDTKHMPDMLFAIITPAR